jgi:hypothetical protein
MYNQIWSPITNEFVPTLSKHGRQALKMYVNSFMTGGTLKPEVVRDQSKGQLLNHCNSLKTLDGHCNDPAFQSCIKEFPNEFINTCSEENQEKVEDAATSPVEGSESKQLDSALISETAAPASETKEADPLTQQERNVLLGNIGIVKDNVDSLANNPNKIPTRYLISDNLTRLGDNLKQIQLKTI